MDTFIVGTIITSYLSWNEFQKQLDDHSAWDAAKSLWAPADGRIVSNSAFNKITGKANVPDYRGVFLRCNNVIDPANTAIIPYNQGDPDGTRNRDSYQADVFQNHAHTFENWVQYADGGHGFVGGGFGSNSGAGANPIGSSAAGGNETRPKNYAVYYYIRIN